MRWLLGFALVVACKTPAPAPPCVGPEAMVDHVEPIAIGSGFAAQAWWSSETHPFDVDAPDTSWFACPHAIAHMLDRQPDVPITTPSGNIATTIEIDPGVTFQSIIGIGISMEESSVANLRLLSQAKRHEVLTRLFDPALGMGTNLVRVTMGTSDFTGRDWYTYDDVPPGQRDEAMTQFSIQRDRDFGILDVLHEIVAINPAVRFFASPWSPPAWMKTSGLITGGALRSEDIPFLATYFRRFVEAYRDEGIPIYAVTLQNEPRTEQPDIPSCFVTAEQEAILVVAIKRELGAAGLDTRAWIFDHNFENGVDYAGDVFADVDAVLATDGVAFHDYAGDPTAMTEVHDRYPDKDILFTEKTLWGVAGVDRAAQYFRNWSRTYVSWLTMLDQDGKPNNGTASQKPRRFVRSISYTGDEYYVTPEHYLFGLYSKFVQPDARRIASSPGSPETVTNVAFENPDGTIVVVVINQTDDRQVFALVAEGNQLWTSLDAKTAATYVWRAGLGPSTLAPSPPN